MKYDINFTFKWEDETGQCLVQKEAASIEEALENFNFVIAKKLHDVRLVSIREAEEGFW